MFGITKKDWEVFLDLARDVGKWALDGFDPMVPEIDEEPQSGPPPGMVHRDECKAWDGVHCTCDMYDPYVQDPEKTYCGHGYWLTSCSICSAPHRRFDNGILAANPFGCGYCGGPSHGQLCKSCQTWAKPKYGPYECWECGKSVPVYVPEVGNTPDGITQMSSGDHSWYAILTQCDGCKAYSDYKSGYSPNEGWARADDPLDWELQKDPGHYFSVYGDHDEFGYDPHKHYHDDPEAELANEPNYDAIKSWETPKAKDFMVKCLYCNGTGNVESHGCQQIYDNPCDHCKGEGQVIFDKRMISQPTVLSSQRAREVREKLFGGFTVAALTAEEREEAKKTKVLVSREVIEKMYAELQEENKQLREIISEMGKIFRKYRDTGKVV